MCVSVCVATAFGHKMFGPISLPPRQEVYMLIHDVCIHAYVCIHACCTLCVGGWVGVWQNSFDYKSLEQSHYSHDKKYAYMYTCMSYLFMCMCMYICMCVCVCIYIYIYIYIHYRSLLTVSFGQSLLQSLLQPPQRSVSQCSYAYMHVVLCVCVCVGGWVGGCFTEVFWL